MSDEVYCYPPDYTVLKNKLNIKDADKLDRAERNLVRVRLSQGVPGGDFDLAHLKAIHRHLFQDVYDWAGELRTVEITKGGSQFQFRRYITTGMQDVHRRLVAASYLKGLSADDFAREAGAIMGDVNYVHPFREGNGRVQALYLEQLATQAGHTPDLKRLQKDSWIAASIAAHRGDYEPMSACIRQALDDAGT